MKKKIIMDCDPGHDDAIAIILAAAAEDKLDLLGITTVAGNVGVEKNTLNTLKVCDIVGLDDVPVYQGADRPIVREPEIAGEIHGETGLDGPQLPEKPKKEAEEGHAVDFIIDTLLESEEKVTLVPTGPLTNIAMALHKEPAIKEYIDKIVLMGGGTYGNWTPTAEFNIYVDAEAAKMVFNSGVDIVVFGLDVTHQAIAYPDTIERLSEIENSVAEFVVDLLDFFGKAYKETFNFDGPPIHDACTIVYLIEPDLFQVEKVYIDIETRGELTYGTMSVDTLEKSQKKPNALFAQSLDQEGFWRLMENALKSYE